MSEVLAQLEKKGGSFGGSQYNCIVTIVTAHRMGEGSYSPGNARGFASIYDVDTGEIKSGGGNITNDGTSTMATTNYSITVNYNNNIKFTSYNTSGIAHVNVVSGVSKTANFNSNQASGFSSTTNITKNTSTIVSTTYVNAGCVTIIGFVKG